MAESYYGFDNLQVLCWEELTMHPENTELVDIYCNSRANNYLSGRNVSNSNEYRQTSLKDSQ